MNPDSSEFSEEAFSPGGWFVLLKLLAQAYRSMPTLELVLWVYCSEIPMLGLWIIAICVVDNPMSARKDTVICDLQILGHPLIFRTLFAYTV